MASHYPPALLGVDQARESMIANLRARLTNAQETNRGLRQTVERLTVQLAREEQRERAQQLEIVRLKRQIAELQSRG